MSASEEDKRKAAYYHNTKVKFRKFKEGDLVLRKLEATGKAKAIGKLRSNQDSPFKVIKVLQHDSYHLEDQERKALSHI